MMKLLACTFVFLAFGPTAVAHPLTIYMAGDSTMAQKQLDKRPETGWGEMLQQHFRPGEVVIENYAKNGASTKSFLEEKLWQAIVEKLRRGDYVLIQFGHNDEVKEKVGRYTTPEEYRANLISFVAAVRGKDAFPILLTSVVRRRFDAAGKFYDTHGEYPDIVRSVAREKNVPLIDMQSKSAKLLSDYGADESMKLFLWLKPHENSNYPDGVQDNTHFNAAGAEKMAQLAVDGIRELNLDLAKYLTK